MLRLAAVNNVVIWYTSSPLLSSPNNNCTGIADNPNLTFTSCLSCYFYETLTLNSFTPDHSLPTYWLTNETMAKKKCGQKVIFPSFVFFLFLSPPPPSICSFLKLLLNFQGKNSDCLPVLCIKAISFYASN